MAGLMKSSIVAVMVMMMVASTTMAQTRHVVGGPLGWTIPPNGAAAYTTWASQQTFTVGDTLYFNFTTGAHNVAEVAQAAYGPCTTTNPISLTATGPATLTLSAAGNHYYVCTVGTHCQIGQKLSINVVGAATAPTPPPTATPPAPTPTSTPTVSPPTATPSPSPVSPPTTTPTSSPTPSAETPTPAPSPVGASPPSPTTTTGPSPSGSTTPPPASDSTPTPPSPSAATRSVVPATLLAFVFALFF